ncbi:MULTISPECIES: glycosyltransferase family 2 protein [Pseudoalteromonas]|uniref:Glycosyltransferase n=1 Tax=Pseudoalteromonas luteoviolacea (strain 2ta16) TaxID=1353533 RepID=V4HZA5_PSEL2|nr:MULTISPECIES: glycosyltransferase family 2 protein [Pseudoalteromonas]ESP95138.1 glycosyltransferase [Pseudoalteromonas luteoviolacea 2ta16]KZN42310.1 glycosyl transferase [Pseudoalteromonas luteoviolacea NCIMB 1944]MCG7547192.1 glycosyltransferase [Pseudoalteromonas sp. Of7M-16]
MKVSIVTVCYNSAETIEDTIRSVVSQTYDDIEYIIVDGGSTDNTLKIVDKYKAHIDVLISEPDRGIYDAMNKGVEAATGDVVGILNSDDFYETKESVASIVSEFDDATDIVFGDLVFVNADNLSKVTRFYSLPKFAPWKLRFGWMPPHPATFIRKSSYDKHGLYKLDYKISADYEMFVRLLLVHKLSFKHVAKTLVRMRDGGVSTSGIQSSIRLNQEIVKACLENSIYTNLLFLLTKIPFKLFELVKRPKNEV